MNLLHLQEPPPSSTIIRVMAIHKTPELVGENVMCCLKHVEELKKKGILAYSSSSSSIVTIRQLADYI